MKNLVLAAFCAALAAACYAATLTFPSPPEAYRSPSVYPQAVIGVILILSAVLAVSEFARKRTKPATVAAPAEVSSTRLPLLVLAVMAGYFVLMQVVGFLLATFVFLLIAFLLFGGRLRPGIVFAAAMTAGQYILFAILLDVRVPDPIVAFIRQSL